MASRPRAATRQRLPLGRSRRRVGYERRLRLILWLLGLPLLALVAILLWHQDAGALSWTVALCGLLLGWAALQAWVADQLLRPLQTLANVVAALREQDYSFRARGARRGDALGDLALEINALASDLQTERLSSLESAALVRRVLAVMEAPVLAFNEQGVLRLLNPAGARLLRVRAPEQALDQHAATLGIGHLLTAGDEEVTTVGAAPAATQWMVRRSRFREHGVPHTLLLLSDVSLALRQEEQQAWQRLIRVLGHEINNSLTPIKSLAGSLRQLVRAGVPDVDFDRPLAVIEERADSLNRFLAAYRQLAQLPPPSPRRFALEPFLRQLVQLEQRVPVELTPGGEVEVTADRDQLAQAVINLLRNGAEAALENGTKPPALLVSWSVEGPCVVVCLRDTGLGIANASNLFVPFYTTKAEGTGTGLVLVKQIAEAHQGTIVLRNHADGGAVAELRLPLA